MTRTPMAHCRCSACRADRNANALLFTLAAVCILLSGWLR